MVKRIIGNPTTTPMAVPDWKQDNPNKADYIKNKPTKLSQFENDTGYLTEHQDISGKADTIHNHSSADVIMEDEAHWWPGRTLTDLAKSLTGDLNLLYEGKADKSEMVGVWPMLDDLDKGKAEKTVIETFEAPSFTFGFFRTNNSEIRLAEVTSISFTFGDGEYAEDYTSGLSFDSGATPTAIDYTDSGILNWVGTDCSMTTDGLSIFQPSANTHYDIVFYFNGTQFIGLVNGFVPASGNVVSE